MVSYVKDSVHFVAEICRDLPCFAILAHFLMTGNRPVSGRRNAAKHDINRPYLTEDREMIKVLFICHGRVLIGSLKASEIKE